MILGDIVMRVPTIRGGRIKLHESNTAFNHPASQQAPRAKLVRIRLADSIQPLRLLRLKAQIYQVGRGRLHAEREFVGGHACGQFVIEISIRDMLSIELPYEVERGNLLLA